MGLDFGGVGDAVDEGAVVENQNACNGQPSDGAELEKLVALLSPNVCRESDLYCLLDVNVQSTDTVDANVS